MPLPEDRTLTSTKEEHLADHNSLHGFFNDYEGAEGILVQAAAPTAPTVGDLWLDTDEPASGTTVRTLGHAQATADQGSIGASDVELTGLSVTVDVPSGARIRITGKVNFQQSSATGISRLRIKESTTMLADSLLSATNGSYYSVDTVAVLTPSTGSHTYTLAMTTSSGAITMLAGAAYPAFILVEDIT